MRVFLYCNGVVVKTKAGMKSVEQLEFERLGEKILADYMRAIAPAFWGEQIPDESIALERMKAWADTLEARYYDKSQQNSVKGNKEKTYYLTSATRRKIQCAAINAYNNRKNKLTFVTLTQNKSKDERETNKWLSKLLDNLEKNYSLNSYIVILELQKNGQPHYHCLFDMPFTLWGDINSAWSNSSGYIEEVKNLVRARKGFATVDGTDSIVRYITKYMGKETAVYRARNYFISRNLLQSIKEEVSESYVNIASHNKMDYISMYKGKFCEVGYIKDYLKSKDKTEKTVKRIDNKPKIHRRTNRKTTEKNRVFIEKLQ